MSRIRRQQRRQQRQESPLLKQAFRLVQHPLPPYEFLSLAQIEWLHEASMRILEEVGLDFLDEEVLTIWEKAGAKVDRSQQHVWLDRGLVMAAIATAPPTFTWRARNPAHNVVIGANHIAFGPCGGMVYVVDENGRRPGTLADLEQFVKLSQICPVLHFASWEQVAPQDIPSSTRHLHRLYAGFTLSDKAVMEAAHGRIITADCVEMARIVFGDLDGDPVIGDVINVNSPLRYDDRMLGGLLTYARAGQVTFITPFILAGAMSPVTMAAALAQQNAEALAGIALTQLVKPGAPVIYGGFTTNIDMKSGSPAFGTPEGAWALLAGAQLARFYKLPYRGNGGLTNAKTADAQSAYETMWNLWPAVQAHTNLVMHAVGWLDGGLSASLEKFVIDAENLAMMCHFLQGFAIDEEALALEMIRTVGAGGHHFGTSHTLARYEGAFYETAVADRSGYDAWTAAGKPDTQQRARLVGQEMLQAYERPFMDVAVQEALTDFVTRREQELEKLNLYD
ncbi:MAG: trimethylamine methyltransferase family protein [Ardenticatenaceae bacterium]|nr:trimethylamine methyltransferase family protein [Ardenticatenaceae bacterium]